MTETADAVSGHAAGLTIESAFLERVVAALEEQVEVLGRIQTVGASNADRRALLVRCEAVSRSLFGLSHTWIADLLAQNGLEVIEGPAKQSLATLLNLSPTRAGQRLRLSEQFGERTAVAGERLDPVLPRTAAAAEDGVLDEEHQVIVKNFFRKLGAGVDQESRENAEAQLAVLARELRPDEFEVAAHRLFDILDPDGDPENEEQIARRCFFRLQRQGADGLSKGSFVVDGETRAYLEAAFTKWAKPGACNPADDTPLVDESAGSDTDTDTDTETDAQERDRRDQGQRQHDALKVIVRQMLASGALGLHRGLPVTAVVSMTLRDLEAGAGCAVTATGSLVRMRDAIRMASHAHHYLVIFDDDGRPLHLGRSKRIASPDQRIVLMAADRGCTFPGCTRPATWSQVHHIAMPLSYANTVERHAA
ncbi:DUF222 domain-containing protein [Rhodococcus yunnanensis]|nr:DUF222 domain-containing protein [Rhodococcus yunnanensis]